MNKACIIALMLVPLLGQAQERFGLSNSNYSGTTGTFLNPSSIVDNKVWLDIRLMGAGAWLHNNFLHIPNSTAYPYLNGSTTPQYGDNYDNNKLNRHVYMQGHVTGPAGQLNIGEHAFAIGTSVRTYTNVNRVPADLAKLSIEGFDYLSLQNQDLSARNMSVDHISFAEISLTYGKILRKDHLGILTGAASLKLLSGITSAHFRADNLNYLVNDTNDMVVADFDGRLKYADPAWMAGKGLGLDIGFTYKRTTESASSYVPHSKYNGCRSLDYIYKIGVSLLDVGYVRFKNANAADVSYSDGQGVLNTNISNPQTFNTSLDGLVVEEGSSTVKDRYTQHLPTAVSVQFDYHFKKHIYFNLSGVQNILPSKYTGVIRPNIVSASARFEHKLFELAMPISLIEYRYPTVGLMARVWGISVGSDILTPFLFKHNIYRADVYFNINIPIYKSPTCRVPNAKKAKRKAMKSTMKECPAFN